MSEKKKLNQTLLAVGALVAIVLALVFIYRQATAPTETITDPKKVIPKGAAKAFREGKGD